MSQEYEVNALFPPMFWLPFTPSINWTQPDRHPHLNAAFAVYHLHPLQLLAFRSTISLLYLQQLYSHHQVCLQSTPQTGEQGRVKDYYQAHIPLYHQLRTHSRLQQAHITLPLPVQPAPYLNVHLPSTFKSQLRGHSQSQNHDYGIKP